MLMSRDELLEELHKHIIVINFTKKNGEKRDLKCTLKQDLLPQHNNSETRKKASNPEIMNVWDVEADGWRAFHLTSVNHVFIPTPE